jgi:hypothetical protein
LEPRRLMSRTIFVDASAPAGGTHDGSSWTAAYTNLSSAIIAATSGDELRVADGTYKPPAGRTFSFQLKNGVKMYGGYAGYGAANPDARDLAQFPSILSGDVGTVGASSDNAYHVITASGVDATAVLDGFTITAGNANDTTTTGRFEGGGLYVASGSPTVNQCIFTGNSSAGVGGAMSGGAPTITGCTFTGNSVTANLPAGGALSIGAGSVSGCTFTNNSIIASQGRGGGALHVYGDIAISGCTFSGNSAVMGGAVWIQSASATFTACTFTANTATKTGGATEGPGTFVNCTFTRNTVTAANGNGGAVSVGPAPLTPTIRLTGCTFAGNKCPGYGGGVSASAFLTVANCTFIGNSAGLGGGGFIGGGNGSPRFANCTLVANSAPLGSAIMGATLPISNCIVRGSSANLTAVIHDSGSATVTVNNSDVQGGYAGSGNIDADPLFVRNPSAGADGNWGTADDDYGDLRLQFNSPCVDAGSNASVPSGVTTDVAGQPRFFDFPSANDPGAIVDMGAYELGTTLGVVRVPDGQSLALPAGRHTFLVEQLSIGTGATLDVRDNSLVLRGTNLGNVQSLIRSGYHGGDWLGSGFTSSTAATDASGITTLGCVSNADRGFTSFGGVSGLTAGDVIVKYTYVGDADLSGNVTLDDFTLFLHGYQTQSPATNKWFNGDFDYNGVVTLDDFMLFLLGYQQQGPPL